MFRTNYTYNITPQGPNRDVKEDCSQHCCYFSNFSAGLVFGMMKYHVKSNGSKYGRFRGDENPSLFAISVAMRSK
jgi:hypothetical protein